MQYGSQPLENFLLHLRVDANHPHSPLRAVEVFDVIHPFDFNAARLVEIMKLRRGTQFELFSEFWPSPSKKLIEHVIVAFFGLLSCDTRFF